jgi:23S rRNA pseudouridine1911/1915/1917 synthase
MQANDPIIHEEYTDDASEENSELYEHKRIVVDPGQAQERLDKFILLRVFNQSRNKIQNTIDAGNILVNDKVTKANYRVKPGDVITAVFAHPPQNTELIAENIPLNIVYEDDDIILINKNPGMVVHPGVGNHTGTMVNGLLHHFQHLPTLTQKKKTDEDARPGLVHRIDKHTSGLIVVAKNEYAINFLAKQFADHSTKRMYTALVWGNVKEDEGTVTGNIARSEKDRKLFTVYPDGEIGKHAVTHYKVIERFGYVTLIQCRLETGRTHQIRVHMKYIGHTLFADGEYGGDKMLKGTTHQKYKQFFNNCYAQCPRQALHATTLGFVHPTTGKDMFFEAPIPADMLGAIEKWRNYANNSMSEE